MRRKPMPGQPADRQYGTTRRQFLLKTGACATTGLWSGLARSQVDTMRIALTPVMLDDQYAFLQIWRNWLEQQLDMPVEFIQRQRYRDITEMLLNRSIDAAWICGYPYARNQAQMRILAMPVYQGESLYQSFIISGRPLTRTDAGKRPVLEDFKSKVMAYSDPDSNSGFLYPVYKLRNILGNNPAFFRRRFFTWGHRNTIEAVASGLADVGAVDSYIWESLIRISPEYRQRVTIVEKSPKFGFPPLVTHIGLEEQRFEKISTALYQMHRDPDGQKILGKLFLDRFATPVEENYASIAAMMKTAERLKLISTA